MKSPRSARCGWYGPRNIRSGGWIVPDPSRQRGRGQVGVVAEHSPLILCTRHRRSRSLQENQRD
jgi:hypothetical protein